MINSAIVIPYFGKWPEWFDLYLFTLNKNPELTTIFFTDISTKHIHFIPKNAKFFNTSFKEYCAMVSQKLDIDFKPKNPYKLCDLKIFYPYLHNDILAEYEYVGWGDIDLIYGNLNKFFPDNYSKLYDFISVYSCILSGPLTLIRNQRSIYMTFFEMPFWRDMLENEIIFNLDEIKSSIFLTPKLNYARLLFEKCGGFKGKNGLFITKIIEIIGKILYPRFHFKELYTTRPVGNNIYKYDNGIILENNSKEIPFLHFFHLKKNNISVSSKFSFEESFKFMNRECLGNLRKFQINKNGLII